MMHLCQDITIHIDLFFGIHFCHSDKQVIFHFRKIIFKFVTAQETMFKQMSIQISWLTLGNRQRIH